MDTYQPNQPQRLHLCRSPKLTPARLAACRANARKSTGPRTARGKARSSLNALKHGRYAHRLTRSLERAEANEQLTQYWSIVGRISRHFRVDWNREQHKTECLARQVWCYGWKAEGRLRTNPRSPEKPAGSKDNSRLRIRIQGNRCGPGLTFTFGPRRRRRLTARVIPILGLAELYALRRLAQLLFETREARNRTEPIATLIGEMVSPESEDKLLDFLGSLGSPAGSGSAAPGRHRTFDFSAGAAAIVLR